MTYKNLMAKTVTELTALAECNTVGRQEVLDELHRRASRLTISATDENGAAITKTVTPSALRVVARHAIRAGWMNIDVRNMGGQDVTTDVPEFQE
jgi:hypothetical protein